MLYLLVGGGVSVIEVVPGLGEPHLLESLPSLPHWRIPHHVAVGQQVAPEGVQTVGSARKQGQGKEQLHPLHTISFQYNFSINIEYLTKVPEGSSGTS